MDTLNRFMGCLTGFAVGDAVGRQLASAGDPLHTPIVAGAAFDVGADTIQLERAARALVKSNWLGGADATLQRTLGEQLVDWYHTPSDPQRPPGSSSREAARRLHWGAAFAEAGNPESDGADAVIHGLPAGLVYDPGEVSFASTLMASVAHTHPTALESSVAFSWLVSATVRGWALTPGLLDGAAASAANLELHGELHHTLREVERAVKRRRGRPPQWLTADEMPPHDGGLRSASAVGLALVTALYWVDRPDGIEPWQAFENGVEMAARIEGNAATVAALTGALLGAHWGLGGVSRHLREQLPGPSQHMMDLARALHLRAHHDEEADDPTDDADLDGAFSTPPKVFGPGDSTQRPSDATDAAWERPRLRRRPEAKIPAPVQPRRTVTATGDVQWVIEGDVDPADIYEAWAEIQRKRGSS